MSACTRAIVGAGISLAAVGLPDLRTVVYQSGIEEVKKALPVGMLSHKKWTQTLAGNLLGHGKSTFAAQTGAAGGIGEVGRAAGERARGDPTLEQ